MAIASINPFDGKVLRRWRAESHATTDVKLSRAARAFGMWRQTTLAQRSATVRRAAELLRQGRDDYARLITIEMGKPITQARAEIEKCAWICEYYADNIEAMLAPDVIATDASRSYVRFDPLGPILAVMPWNFPFWQVFRFAAPALMAGNVGLLKHASNVPQCALAISEVLRRAGAPTGVFQTLLIEAGAVTRVIEDRRVAAVTLTGSEPAGSHVAAVAGRVLKKTVLELGGSDPFIVLRDANLAEAAVAAAQARTINSGQSCIAAKRFIVESAVLPQFTKFFVEAMAGLTVGNPLDEQTAVGPLARPDLARDLHKQVQRSVRRGAKLLLGGKPISGSGNFYPPTVLANVRPGMAAFDEELFGPVAALIAAKDADDAVRLANLSSFGLGASVWTGRPEIGEQLAARIEAGEVHINNTVKSDPRLPFGGVKRSGYGREMGFYGLREFTNIKSVVVR